MVAVAQQFGMHYTTLSRIVNEAGRYKTSAENRAKTKATLTRAAKVTGG
jgi:hypothetical protein